MKRNIKTTKICAFCKNWFDPACSAVNPVTPVSGWWEVDNTVKKLCLKRNGVMRRSDNYCGDFEKKSF